MNALKTVWHDILLVWTFFTRLPAPPFQTPRSLSQALWALPFGALFFAFCQFSLAALLIWADTTPLLSAVILVLLPILVSGALHWDGLADFFDGLGVAPARRAVVMRDSSLGAFGVLALLFAALLQVALISQLLSPSFLSPSQWSLAEQACLIAFAPFVSRLGMGLLWAVCKPSDADGQLARLGQPDWRVQLAFALAALLILTAVLGPLPWALGAFVGGSVAWGWFVHRALGGMSGDGLGASQVAIETLFLGSFIIAV